MKFYILNNEPVNFYNTNGDLTGQISVSASGDMTIRPTSGSGAGLILGNPNTVSDIEFGSVAAPVSLTMLGGGTLSSNGNLLTIGNVATGDRVSINNATYSQSLAVTGSLSVTGSVIANYFIGNGIAINFSGLPTTQPTTTGSLWISGSSPNHPQSGYLMIFNP